MFGVPPNMSGACKSIASRAYSLFASILTLKCFVK